MCSGIQKDVQSAMSGERVSAIIDPIPISAGIEYEVRWKRMREESWLKNEPMRDESTGPARRLRQDMGRRRRRGKRRRRRRRKQVKMIWT